MTPKVKESDFRRSVLAAVYEVQSSTRLGYATLIEIAQREGASRTDTEAAFMQLDANGLLSVDWNSPDFLARITDQGMSELERTGHIPPEAAIRKEVRDRLLQFLFVSYVRNPDSFSTSGDLSLGGDLQPDEVILAIKYLSGKGLIEADAVEAGKFRVRISASGIDSFEKGETILPEDYNARLVEMAESLRQQLGILTVNIVKVLWTDWVRHRMGSRQDHLLSEDSRSVYVPTDWCLLRDDTIVMPARMMSRLSLEEWRPLIASSILYDLKLARSLRLRESFLIAIPLGVLAVALSASIILQRTWLLTFPGATPLILALFVLVAILERRLYIPNVKKARLEADIEASFFVGKDTFLDVLRKLYGINLGDKRLRNNGKNRQVFPGLPSTKERIENLQGVHYRESGRLKDLK